MSVPARLPEAERRDRVEALLARHGTTADVALTHVSPAFGEPVLVVATGSVPAGYGNEGSDCDLYAVVPEDDLTQLPIVALEDELRVDVRYFSAGEVAGHADAVAAPWPEPGASVDRRAWLRRRGMLESAVRFAVGVTLTEQPPWDGWKAALEGPDLGDAVVGLWALETKRRAVAARWLQDGSIGCDHRHAVLYNAAANLAVAGHGHVFFGSKWLPEKLRRVGDERLDQLFLRSIEHPLGDETRATIVELAAELAPFGPDDEVQLHLAPGVRVDVLLGRTIVSRWQMRAVEVLHGPGVEPDLGLDLSGEGPAWRGGVDDEVPELVARLFRDDYFWLSVGRRG